MATRADLSVALTQWKRASGPYWMYVCAAPFVNEVDDHRAAEGQPVATSRLTDLVARLPSEKKHAVFVDRPPVSTLLAAPELIHHGYQVVPVIQRWCTFPAVVRSERLVRALVDVGEAVGPVREPRGVVFILDGDRLGPRRRSGAPAPRRWGRAAFDNRYQYSVDRFPPPELLAHERIAAVRWVGGDIIASDLQAYARRLAEAGLGPELLGVDQG